MKRILLAVAGILALATPTMGGHCGSFSRKVYGGHHYVKAVQVVAPYYLVGQNLRDDARDAKLIQKAIQAYAAQQGKFRGEGRFVIEGEVGVAAGGTVGGDVGTSVPDAGGGEANGYSAEAAALITNKCLSCHSPENAKGGLDLTQNITDDRIAKALFTRTFSRNPALQMPPGVTLTDDEKEVFFQLSEALQLSIKGVSP